MEICCKILSLGARLRLMPAELEAIVRRRNARFSHEGLTRSRMHRDGLKMLLHKCASLDAEVIFPDLQNYCLLWQNQNKTQKILSFGMIF